MSEPLLTAIYADINDFFLSYFPAMVVTVKEPMPLGSDQELETLDAWIQRDNKAAPPTKELLMNSLCKPMFDEAADKCTWGIFFFKGLVYASDNQYYAS